MYSKTLLTYKFEILQGVKGFIILLIGMLLSATFIAPYINLLNWFLASMTTYLVLTLFYFAYEADKDERKTILNMWKLYFSIIVIMIALIYTIEGNINKQKIDYQKTKLNYELKLNSNEANSTFQTYSNLVLAYIKNFNTDTNTSKINKKENEKKIVSYANFSINILNIVTLFMFLWALTEFKLFEKKVTKYSKYRYDYKSKKH